MMAGQRHTNASPDHCMDMKSSWECAWMAMPKEAWGFQCPGLPLAQRSLVWLLSFGVSLAPEQSGNLNLILSPGCLRFQESCNVPRLILCVHDKLAKVCESVAHIPVISAWKISSLPRYAKNHPAPAWSALPYCGLTFYIGVEVKQKSLKTQHICSPWVPP